jgi:hypothetical protein
MIGDYINLSDHSTAQLVARAVERAEGRNASVASRIEPGGDHDPKD